MYEDTKHFAIAEAESRKMRAANALHELAELIIEDGLNITELPAELAEFAAALENAEVTA